MPPPSPPVFAPMHVCHNIYSNERATRVVIHSYLYSGLRPSVRGKITSDNGNLKNLRYTKNICHVILSLIT